VVPNDVETTTVAQGMEGTPGPRWLQGGGLMLISTAVTAQAGCPPSARGLGSASGESLPDEYRFRTPVTSWQLRSMRSMRSMRRSPGPGRGHRERCMARRADQPLWTRRPPRRRTLSPRTELGPGTVPHQPRAGRCPGVRLAAVRRRADSRPAVPRQCSYGAKG